jgi:hypothetical protein
MRKRTAILASAILAVSGFGLGDPIVSMTFGQISPTQHPAGLGTSNAGGQQAGSGKQAQPSNQAAAAGATGTASQRDQQNETKGVQQLFAQATDEALKPNGVQQLQALFVSENAGQLGMGGMNTMRNGVNGAGAGNAGQAGAAGSPNASGGASGLSARAGNTPAGANGGATAAKANGPGNGGATSSASNQSPDGNNTSVGLGQPNAIAAGQPGGQHPADLQALNQTIQQFDQAWKQKYGSDFTIQNASQVYADVNAADIMPGMPQPAGSGLRGTGNAGSNGAATGGTGANDAARAEGNSAATAGAAGGSSTSPTGGLHQNVGPTGATAGASTRGQAGPGAGTAAVAGIGAAGNGMINEEVTVNVPPVQGTQAVTVRLLRSGPSSFRFASQMQRLHEGRLASALAEHLRDVMAQKDRWPADKNQAARLVTQHVLMAIAECQTGLRGSATGLGAENAQPAASRIAGHNQPDTTLGSSGTGQVNTKGRTPAASGNNR